ncbi:MAG: FRG domain-containing protein [Bacteroidetes bacterium]|nr:FRG domain-containing protein [Bacteroidota bacterium]
MGHSLFSSFAEKEQYYFVTTFIETEEQLETLWIELLEVKKRKEFIFRGVKEANYKLYNSAQRYFLDNQDTKLYSIDYNVFIKNSIDAVRKWNNSTVERYLNHRGIGDNCVAYLSLMQHFDVPTPFLDFSYNPFVALYFSSLSKYVGNEQDMGNYSSLYLVRNQHPILQNALNYFQQFLKDYDEGNVPYRVLDFPLFLLFDSNSDIFRITNNKNIINQEGVLFFNNHSFLPLEEYFTVTSKYSKALKGWDVTDGENKLFACWNIAKKLHPIIQSRLKKDCSIDHDFLFPDFTHIRHAFNTSVEKYNLEFPPPSIMWR